MGFINRFLTTIGLLAIIFTTVSFVKLCLALHFQTDFTAAFTSSPPRAAFANQAFWITGASSGIGRALALHLCSHHDDVRLILSSRRESVLQEVATECKAQGNGAIVKVLPVDLADHATLKSKAEEALAMFGGRIDVLVNNGGVSTRSMARNANFDVDVFVTNVDFLSYVALTKALLPRWESHSISSSDNDSGHTLGPMIINTSSVVGRFGGPVRTAYSGAKHAIMGWFDAFRVEQSIVGYPIHILNVVLGSTQTDVARNAITVAPDRTFGDTDGNIESGLEPAFVVERVLAAAYAGGQGELWIAPRRELLLLYLNQYVPAMARKVLTKAMGKQYAVEKKSSGEGEKDNDKEL